MAAKSSCCDVSPIGMSKGSCRCGFWVSSVWLYSVVVSFTASLGSVSSWLLMLYFQPHTVLGDWISFFSLGVRSIISLLMYPFLFLECVLSIGENIPREPLFSVAFVFSQTIGLPLACLNVLSRVAVWLIWRRSGFGNFGLGFCDFFLLGSIWSLKFATSTAL